MTGVARFRVASEMDCEALGILAARTFTATFGHLYTPENLAGHLVQTCSAAYFREALRDGDTIILLYVGDVLAGYGKAGWMRLPVDRPPSGAMELHRCYLDAPYQGQGLGMALIAYLLDLPEMKNAPMVYLSVWEENLRAQAAYRKFGFLPVGNYLYQVGTQYDREIIMARRSAA